MRTTEDPREAAARYRIDRAAADEARARGEEPPASDPEDEPRGMTEAERAAFVEQSIRQAVRRGDFADLPGAGRPLAGLGDTHDPDWWIKRKIESEQLRGLGPPALTLRVENTQLNGRLDELSREDDVRETLEDFNRRVIEARRQLLGGPPVVTPTRDVDAEIDEWHARRSAREAEDAARTAASQDRTRRRGRRLWRRRRER